jgi:class 3 adenylate cyclase/predicted ATPase
MDVAGWLRSLGLERYEQAFRDNDIDAGVLSRLTADDLIAIGVTSVGHRRRLLDAIASLSATTEPAEDVVPPAAAEHQRARAVEAERRQLTVMFVDLVDSTVLANKLDPEVMRDVLRVYQNAVAGEVVRFDGHVAKFMGDAVLAYFGWPRAHEDEAERSVRTGLAIVKAVSKLATPAKAPLGIRVGIATGLVVVGDLIGEGVAQEEAVVGETPNLAARLQALAEPGTVVLAEGTRRLLGSLFHLDDLGARELKGFANPVRSWRVIAESRVESRFDALHGLRLSPLIGREQELALLLERWRRAKTGEGQVVLLSGEPGIGKSRIALALYERLQTENHLSLRYHGSPYHTNSPLLPIIDQLERAADLARDDPADLRLAKLEALLAVASPDALSIAPLIADLLGVPSGERSPAIELAPDQKKLETFRALLRQLEGLAAKQPVLMIAEDAHWFDHSSLELFDLIVERIERLPVLLVITFRPEFGQHWTGWSHVTLLTLNRLGRTEGAALIEHLARGKSLPAAAVAQILTKTDGVALFVEELTKSVLESGILRDCGDHFDFAESIDSLAIPATLHDSLMARLDRLGAAKELAQTASVIGRQFSYELLAAVAEMNMTNFKAALDELVRAELVFRHGTAPEVTYAFKHVLVQDAAYRSLLKGRRQWLHGRIAEALERRLPKVVQSEPETLARHYFEAGAPESAIRYWLRAGQLANRHSANSETIAHCEKGLALVEQVPETPERDQQELELRITLGSALLAVKGFAAPEVSVVYGRARELCHKTGEAEQLFAVLYGLWINRLFNGELEAARELSAEMLALAQRQSDDGLLLQGHHVNWTTSFYLSEMSQSLHHAKIGIALYDFDRHRHHAFIYGGHDPGVCCRGIAAWCLWFLGYADQALSAATDALNLARQLSHPFSESQALLSLAPIHCNRGEVELTRQVADAALRLCIDQGFGAHTRSLALALHGWALVRAGSGREGIKQLRQGIDERPRLQVELLTLLADACLHVGQIEEGLAVVNRALPCAEVSERIWIPELLCLNGQLLLASSTDAGEVQSCFEQAFDAARGLGAKSLELRAAVLLSRLLAGQGRLHQAHDLLAPIYGWFTEGFDTADLKGAQALLDGLG